MAGLGTLIKLIIRRDRVKLPIWVGVIVLSLVAMVPLLRDIYGDEESLATLYATFSANPAGSFMTGPMDEPTFGAFMMLETLLWWGMAVAFLNTLLVVRHTRHNEEIGAQELLMSGQVSRSASLTAALVAAAGVNGLIVLGIGFGFQLVDTTWSVSQSWLYALAMGGFGFAWAAAASVVVQLVESGRSANGILAGLIGLGFVLRGVGDFLGKPDASGLHQPEWMSSLSPFGWLQATRPLTSSPEWWPLIITFGFTFVAAMVGYVLLSRRDVGAGILPSSAGKSRASRLLKSPLGLAVYVQKNVFIGWLLGVLAMVGTIGVLVPQMGDVYSASDSMRQMIESIGGVGELLPSFLAAMIAMTSLLVFAYSIHALGKMRSEESSGRLENILATKISRLRWLSVHLGIVLVGGILMLVTTGVVLALCVNLMSDISVDMWEYSLSGLAYLPVLLGFMALYLVVFGLLPRLANGVSWLYYGFVTFALWLGPIVKLDQVVMNLSIMEHMATPPLESILWTPVIATAAASTILGVLGVVAFCRRDTVAN